MGRGHERRAVREVGARLVTEGRPAGQGQGADGAREQRDVVRHESSRGRGERHGEHRSEQASRSPHTACMLASSKAPLERVSQKIQLQKLRAGRFSSAEPLYRRYCIAFVAKHRFALLQAAVYLSRILAMRALPIDLLFANAPPGAFAFSSLYFRCSSGVFRYS